MNTKKIVTSALIAGLSLAAFPAFAQTPAVSVGASASAQITTGGSNTSANATVNTKLQTREANEKAKASQEIQNRIDALNKMLTRVQAMVKLSASEKSTISGEVQAEITDMNNLKVKIDADTDSATLKTDMQSITKSYRVYALVLPQAAILAAADRVQTIATDMTTISAKLQARITADQTAGKNVTALQAALTDYNAKVADANTQATAAVTATASLTPDNGNTTIAASNKAALEKARADIKAAMADLKAARADATTIIKGLKSLAPTPSVSASASASANTQ